MRTGQKEQKTIEIEATGSYVYKESVRKAISVNHIGWGKEITHICQTQEGFSEKYQPYKSKRKIPASIARIIIETIYLEMGYDVTIEFLFLER